MKWWLLIGTLAALTVLVAGLRLLVAVVRSLTLGYSEENE